MVHPIHTSGKAIASLVLGILTLFMGMWTAGSRSLPVFILCIVVCLFALVLGIVGRKEIAKDTAELAGARLAGWGIGLSITGPILGLVMATFG